MKRTYTTAIIVALTTTIVSLDVAAATGTQPARANHQTLSLGPGKKDNKPVVVTGEVTRPAVDRSVVKTQEPPSRPAKEDYQRNFVEGSNGTGTTGVSDAVLNLMFGRPSSEPASNNAPRRPAPTLKKID